MFSIGDFAQLGRVSVRMLRHYDALGLLRPARVDPASGYRFYRAAQLARLNRIIALKDLGFTLSQIASILDEKVSLEELHGMVRLRRAELEERIAADTARLLRVEARLRAIETEGLMSTEEVMVKRVAPVRVAELKAVAASYESEDIGPVIQPLYRELCARLERAGVAITGPGIASYEAEEDGKVVVHAGMQVTAAPDREHDFAIVDLPAIETAATIIHRGPMEQVGPSFQVLARWIEENGYRPVGLAREVYLDCPDDRSQWVTELQMTVTPS
ncbi:MerR family transcriptional regulator [Planobispora rosea]|uniref:MerR family transcriptional regulator n=1 Tax=Planobispora rosea TaxID=35762 RepID=A0A8J3SA09_PLARO|nr:MerR family transcriptional regulator [Planobispora rosea]GGT04297.1 MerR family transcriptional regulator [Planobispora rosea]GIH88812.1 MerR family transcriptional regulator [Planobispora rosea]